MGVPCRRSRASLIATTALSTTPTQHEAVIGTVNRVSMWELCRRRVHSAEPNSACARQITRHGFKVPPSTFRALPEGCRKRPENQISHGQIGPGFQQLLRYLAALRGAQVAPALIDADDVVVGVRLLLAITELEPVGG